MQLSICYTAVSGNAGSYLKFIERTIKYSYMSLKRIGERLDFTKHETSCHDGNLS